VVFVTIGLSSTLRFLSLILYRINIISIYLGAYHLFFDYRNELRVGRRDLVHEEILLLRHEVKDIFRYVPREGRLVPNILLIRFLIRLDIFELIYITI